MGQISHIAIYRMCEDKQKNANTRIKNKPDYVTNEACLRNFRKNYDGKLIVLGDNLKESREMAEEIADIYMDAPSNGNVETYRYQIDYISSLDNDTIAYIVEDDYIHLPNIIDYLEDGLSRFDYVSLYDHPDKHGAMKTFIYSTKLSHWIGTHSTTLTFAGRVGTIKQDIEQLKSFDFKAVSDHAMWLGLGAMGRTLGTPIPSRATHGEDPWLAPVIDWGEHV